METGQEGLNYKTSQLVAVYRFVIVDGKACINDNPGPGIWISKDDGRKEFTYTAHLARVITAVKVLDLNEDLKKVMNEDNEGWTMERDPSQEASGVVDRQIEELGKTPSWSMILDTPMKARGGTNDENGNDLLRFSLLNHPLGIHGARREEMGLCWAKKEVPGGPMTVLSGTDLERFKLEGKLA